MEQSKLPLVTVILTTFNHQNFVDEALRSVFLQSYKNVQLVVVDNASSDGTCSLIEKAKEDLPSFVFIKNSRNRGLCAAFNQAFSQAEGKYVIDLSGDDVLLPDRIENQVEAFEKLSNDFAVVYSNARHIDEKGKPLNHHYKTNKEGKAVVPPPSGDVYSKVLERYFICTPTMMMRTEHVRALGGYDESLTFEDFDFWVRSAAQFKYFYLDKVTTLKRNVPGSLSSMVYKKQSRLLHSYYVVCNKAYDLNRNQDDFDLLAARIRTFIRKCLYAQEFDLALKFRQLLNYIENPGLATELVVFLCRMRLPVNPLYRFYINHLQKIIHKRKDLALEIVS